MVQVQPAIETDGGGSGGGAVLQREAASAAPRASVSHHPAGWARFAAVFSTSAAVGIAATLLDWSVLVISVRILHVPQAWAIIPAFLAGLLVQFVGNQRYAFRARATAPAALWRQARRFALVEAGSLALNALIYNLLRDAAHVDYRAARVVAGLLVYLAFSLPLWHWVFANPRDASGDSTTEITEHTEIGKR